MSAVTAIAGLLTVAQPAAAQRQPIIQRGDAVVTAFAGTVAPAEPPADVHPLDRTFIDLKGLTTQIFDLSNLGGGPSGQLADAPVKFKATAGQIGHVFGIAFEGDGSRNPPNIFLSASSLYGLQIVKGDGADMKRLVNGEEGARFMPGQFGPNKAGPGSIFRVDGTTGEIKLFATVKYEDRDNSGPGLGNLTYDPRTKQLFVSDLETGMIHRITMDGRERDIYDHGVTGRRAAGLAQVAYDPKSRVGIESSNFNVDDATTWGYAPKARMTFGLAILNNRLYYSVGEGPQIWSVSIDDEGDFGKDARIEVAVKDTPANEIVTAIKFDGGGYMYLAQRGEFTGSYDYQLFAKPQRSLVLRYQWDGNAKKWAEAPEEYAIGLPPEHRATVGGIALNYGYDRNGRIDYGACRQTLWTTGEHLREGEDLKRVSTGGPRVVHGLQGNYKSKVRPANEPPFETWFIDYDGRFEDAEINGHIGNIGIYNPCDKVEQQEAMQTPTAAPGEPDYVVEKRCFAIGFGGRVRCLIVVRNNGGSAGDEEIVVLEAARVLRGPHEGAVIRFAEVRPDRDGWQCAALDDPQFACRLPGAALGPGAARSFEVWIDTRTILVEGDYGFRNCAILMNRFGSGRACYEGGTDIVVEKTGPLVCQPGGICRYGLTIRNNGTDPFSGDVMVTDQLTKGGAPFTANITSMSPSLGCSPDPAQVPFTCIASVTLTAGESRTISIDIQIPGGDGGFVLENCFGVTDPVVVADNELRGRLFRRMKFSTDQIGFFSCVRTRIPWERQPPPDTPWIPAPPGSSGFIPVDPVCWNGQPPLPGGRCACPGNSRWDPETGECRRPPEHGCYDPSRRMPGGQCCPWGSEWNPLTFSCRRPHDDRCRDPSRRTPSGDCCPAGTHWNWRTRSCGEHVKTCEDGRPPLPNGLCGCPRGTRWDPITRSCGKPGDETGGKCPDGSPKKWGGRCGCGDGQVWNVRSQRCDGGDPSHDCRGNTVWNPRTKHCEPKGDTQCRGGMVWNPRSQRCEPKGETPKCPLNQPIYNPTTKRCERATGDKCPEGQRMVNGKCQAPTTGDRCPDGQRMINGKCQTPTTGDRCPDGQRMINGKCQAPTTGDRCPAGQQMVNGKCQAPTTGDKCPAGQQMVNGKCQPRSSGGCPAGQSRDPYGQCQPTKPTGTKDCPAGQHMVNGKCQAMTPSGECKPGFTRTASGACLPKSVTERCGAGRVKQADGSCKEVVKKIVPKKIEKVEPKKKADKPVVKKPERKQEVKKVPVPRRSAQQNNKPANKPQQVRRAVPKKPPPNDPKKKKQPQ